MTMLPAMFDVLRKHPRASVRVATVHAAAALLAHCSAALPECTAIWLESLLALAQDPWPQVSVAAAAALQGVVLVEDSMLSDAHAPDEPARIRIRWAALRATLLQHLSRFGDACSRGEADVISSTRLLTGAAYLAGPARVVEVVHDSPATRMVVCKQLLKTFRVSALERAAQPAAPVELNLALASPADACADAALPRRHPQYAVLMSDEARAFRMSIFPVRR